MNRPIIQLIFLLTLVTITACSSSSSTTRPVVETNFVEGSADYTGILETDYFIPQSADTDLNSLPQRKGIRYVKVDTPGFQPPTVQGGMTEMQNTMVKVINGFTCPVRGKVFVGALIDSNGRAHEPRVTGGIHPVCDAKAIEFYQKLRFIPATVNGKNVAMPLAFPINFN